YSLPTANNVNGRYRASSGWRSATADHADSTVPPSVDRARSGPALWLHGTGRTGGPGRARWALRLEPVRLAAAAAPLHVRIRDREAGAEHAVVDVVDLAAGEIRRAVPVDVDLDAVRLHHVVVRLL